MSLHRKLIRLFGAESVHSKFRDEDVERLIKEFVFANTADNGRQISDLVATISLTNPDHYRLVKKLLEKFRPGTVVTMVRQKDPVDELVLRLDKVSKKMLSIGLHHFGSVPYEDRILQSAKDLIPCVADDPDGPFAKALRRIVLRMEMA
jgi:flagellar biosynthesis protein FlhG